MNVFFHLYKKFLNPHGWQYNIINTNNCLCLPCQICVFCYCPICPLLIVVQSQMFDLTVFDCE